MTQRKGGSGEHPALTQFRRKAESFDETTLPMLEGLKGRVERGEGSSPPGARSEASSPPPEVIALTPVASAVVVITLHGSGTHQGRLPSDVAGLVSEMVERLRADGHVISFASIAYGGESVVVDRGLTATTEGSP